MTTDDWKTLVEIVYYVVAMAAAFGAFWVYRGNSRLERAKWASSLYDKFYGDNQLKEVRDLLDASADSEQVNELVLRQEARFTDYLNFFEYVAFLTSSKQLRDRDVRTLFGYYLDCLRRHPRVRTYIETPANGYEELHALLGAGR